MKIQLDATALEALIKSDPNFEVELRRAVVVQAARRTFLSDAASMAELIQPELFKETVQAIREDDEMTRRFEELLRNELQTRSNWSGRPTLSPEQLKIVAGAVNDFLSRNRDEMIREAYATFIKDIDEKIKKIVEVHVPVDINQIVERQVKARIQQLKDSL